MPALATAPGVGPGMFALIDGMPQGLELDVEFINMNSCVARLRTAPGKSIAPTAWSS